MINSTAGADANVDSDAGSDFKSEPSRLFYN